MMKEKENIRTDINRDRIQEVVGEAYEIIVENVGGNFILSKGAVLDTLKRILDTGRVSTQFFLSLGSVKAPDLELRVDPVRREVLCKSGSKRLAANLNHLISVL